MTEPVQVIHQLRDTQRAFDSVAAGYDGPIGNNALVQHMRRELWRTVTAIFPPGSRLLDIGCGTGLDAAHLASHGYNIVATDWSGAMAQRTRDRVVAGGLEDRVTVRALGMHQLDQLRGERIDGMYSNLGPLNCAPDLGSVARSCAGLLHPGGQAVFSVIGRICPWEVTYYALHGSWRRVLLRGSRGPVPVPLNGQTVWTHYYLPREFYRAFEPSFHLVSYRALALVLPPPYLIQLYARFPSLHRPLALLETRLGRLPVLRNLGDHFLMVLTKRD